MCYVCLLPDRSSQLRVRQLAGENGKGKTAERLGSIVQLKAGKKEMEHICLPHFNGKGTWEFYSKQLQVVTWCHSWMATITAMQLCLALEGKTLQVRVGAPWQCGLCYLQGEAASLRGAQHTVSEPVGGSSGAWHAVSSKGVPKSAGEGPDWGGRGDS